MERSLTTSVRSSYFALVILLPLLGAPLAVNGSAVFQIIAIEELGLTSRQVGLAVGLGAISIPFQIWAAHIPLRLAHRHMRLYLLTMSAMCLAMAWLMTGPGSPAFVVTCALAIAILAELAVSVLFATSFQPLLSTTIGPQFRQRLNAQGRAAGGVLSIGLVVLVGWTSTTGRVAIVIGLAVIAAALWPVVSHLNHPTPSQDPASTPQSEPSEAADLKWIFAAIAISVVPAWPFFVTYAADAYWPSANLGLIGAALVVGGLGAAALWRPAVSGLAGRARLGAIVVLGCSLALVPLNKPLHGSASEAIVIGILVAATAAGTIVRTALLEMVHMRSNETTSVAALTRLDVIASTCMQVGFLAAGFLIELSVDSTWRVDPFQLSLIAGGALLVVATTQIVE
ncbi:MAG: hypothetical protein R2706_18480 [Acidimicrobiales bacterium]